MSELVASLKRVYVRWSTLPEIDRYTALAAIEPNLGLSESPAEAQILWSLLRVRDVVDTPNRMQAVELLDVVEQLADQTHQNAWASEIHRLRAFILQCEGKLDEAFQLLIKASTEAQASENYWSMSMITLNLGVISANSGDYDGASVYLKRCLEHAQLADVDPAMQAHAHLILAQSQLERGATIEALYHSTKSYEGYRELGNSARLSSSATLLVSVNIELGNIASAKEVMATIDVEEATSVQLVSLLNLRAKLSCLEGSFTQAHIDHDRAIALASEIGNQRLTTNSIQLKCETLLLEGRADETIRLLESITDSKGYDLLSLHELKGKALEQLGKFKAAFDEVKKFAVLQKELLSERASNALSRLRAAQEVLQAEREAAHFRERSQFYAKELSQRTSYLVQQNEYVNNVIDHIQLLSRQRPEVADMLKDIRKRLRELPAASFDWNEYIRLFDEIHPNALAVLQQQYPDLSPTESKICSLVLAKLSNGDIARLLSCSERTVENHRHRLRKKLGLAVGVDLTTFLERTLSEHPAAKPRVEAPATIH